MDILKLEIRGSERVLLSLSLATSVLVWGYTLWRRQQQTPSVKKPKERRAGSSRLHVVRSPVTPRTRGAFKRRGCTCKMVTTTDDCRQNKQKNKWIGSEEEETDTDTNLIPSSMRSNKQIMLNR